MGVRTEFPRRVRRIDNAWIPLADGTRLAARIWLPDDAEADPVPAILEYLPYRKGDAMARRDSRHHPYFAGHGYAAVRVDLRGTRRLRRHPHDEYTRQEEDDALEVLAWLAAQPWCTGRVGMFGISWGGFNGLQVAARRPPELRAVISMCASDDRYADDVHYIGGCVLALDMLPWAATMLTLLAQPPDPATVGDGWRERGSPGMERTPAFVEPWLAHQRRDDYWRHGSVCEDYARDRGPGLRDRRLGRRLHERDPAAARRPARRRARASSARGRTRSRRTASPGPAIGFLQECLRWWDHWLKDVDTGVMDEPMLRAWMQEPVRPAGPHAERPGRWVAEGAWPSPGVAAAEWTLGAAARLPPAPTPTARPRLLHHSPDTTGQDAGAWCADGGAGDWPGGPARRGRPLAHVHLGTARRARRGAGFPEVDARRRGRPAAGARRGPAVRRRPRRRRRCS